MSKRKTKAPDAPEAAQPTAGAGEPAPSQNAASGASEQPRQWANPYRAIFTCSAKGFELGHNVRFKQLVFTFDGNPGSEITGQLKAAGFVYRGQEKAWTIAANAANREIAEGLAMAFKGESPGMVR